MANGRQFSFSAPLWQHDNGPVHFCSVPEQVSDVIDDLSQGRSHGFGSVPVEVTVGTSTWQTSLFPSIELATYVLPMKKAVRTKEQLETGEEVVLTLTLREVWSADSS
ncbi:MAG: DUF1905 domain-containing protein [Ornithinimicrobium sp.]